MHELGIASEIVAIACEHVRPARVRRVVVAIGRLTAVLPEAVRFCFACCAEGTAAEDAELEVREIDGLGRCRRCGRESIHDRPYGECPCGHAEFDWLAGEELHVLAVEVADVHDLRV